MDGLYLVSGWITVASLHYFCMKENYSLIDFLQLIRSDQIVELILLKVGLTKLETVSGEGE